MKWVKEQREQHYMVSLNAIKKQALVMAKDLSSDQTQSETDRLKLANFRASCRYVKGFLSRNNLSYRAPTHRAQQNLKTRDKKCVEVLTFLNSLNSKSSDYRPEFIFNMDETPFFFDLLGRKTVDTLGKRSIEASSSGHEKSRFTVVVTISAAGKLLPFYIIFRGLKNIPKIDFLPSNFVINVSDSGTMDMNIMQDYIHRIILPETKLNKSLLIMDEFAAHKTPVILDFLKKSNIETLFVPGGYTYCLQPLDVCINKPLKDGYKAAWELWHSSVNTLNLTPSIVSSEFTSKAGNRKKPSYTQLINMVESAANSIGSEMIRNSFIVCGLMNFINFNWPENMSTHFLKLNSSLKFILYIESVSNYLRDNELSFILKHPNPLYVQNHIRMYISEFDPNTVSSESNSLACNVPIVAETPSIEIVNEEPEMSEMSASIPMAQTKFSGPFSMQSILSDDLDFGSSDEYMTPRKPKKVAYGNGFRV